MSISNGLGVARRVANAPSRIRGTRASWKRLLLLALGLCLLGVALVPAVVRAPPPIPMTTQGNAYDRSGAPLPPGTPVRTFIDGVDYSNHSVVLNAQGAYSVLTAGNLVLNGTTPEPSPRKEGANPGEILIYAASDFTSSADTFQEVLPWYQDRTVTQALHLGTVQTTPQALKIQGIVTQPARGGPQYVTLCNPTASSVSLANYYLQTDRPGTYFGGNLTLSGAVASGVQVRINLTGGFPLIPTGDALKLVYHNPGGAGASAAGRDIVVDRVEFNATIGGTLDWQPGSTILGSAPAPGPGQILERSAACADTNSPSDLHLAREPGLPSGTSVNVTLTAPTLGQNVAGNQVFTFRWTMTDSVFLSTYLRVWVNVTYRNVTTILLAGTAGATSIDWNVPDVSAPNAVVRVDVVDPFGAVGNTTATFNMVPATPYSIYVAVLVTVVIAAFLLLAFFRGRRRKAGPPTPPAGPPSLMPAPSSAPETVSPAIAAAPATKVCPQCHRAVQEADETCFYCGHAFMKPPP